MDANDPLLLGQQILSQSEVEGPLTPVAVQEASTLVPKTGGSRQSQLKDAVQPYDFPYPVFLSAVELRKLRVHHEEFIHSLAARFSIYLRLEFGLQMSQLQTLTYQKFVNALANPCHLNLFKVEPLRGICILDINPRLGLTIVDRLMGGPGHSVSVNRDLSEIEVALLDQAIHLIMVEWCNHWAKVQDLRPVLLGHENNGRFLQTAPPDAVILTLSMEARLGDCVEQIQIGFPYATLEPLLSHASLKLDPQPETTRPAPKTAPPKWKRELDDIAIPLTAEWSGMKLSARRLARLKVGEVLPLPADFANHILVRLANIPKFDGRLGTRDSHWAVELTNPVKT